MFLSTSHKVSAYLSKTDYNITLTKFKFRTVLQWLRDAQTAHAHDQNFISPLATPYKSDVTQKSIQIPRTPPYRVHRASSFTNTHTYNLLLRAKVVKKTSLPTILDFPSKPRFDGKSRSFVKEISLVFEMLWLF